MKRYILLLITIFCILILSSQKTDYTLNVNDGLSSSYIRYIHSDENGLIWIGTDNGLDKFDGKTIVNYANRFKIPLKGAVQQIFTISTNEYLIATEQGAFIYSISKNKISPIEFNHPGINVRTICRTNNDNIYMGTDKGLYQLLSDSLIARKIILNKRKNISETSVMKLISDPAGILWIATLDGLYSYDPQNKDIKHFVIGNDYLSNNLHSIVLTQNYFYIGTDNGVYQFKKDGISSLIKGTEHLYILSLEQGNNSIYIGLENQGVKVYNIKEERIYDLDIKKSGNISVLNIHLTDNYLWLGTFNEGVIKVDLNKNNQFENQPIGRIYNFIPRSHLFYKNQVFVGTRDGLAILNKKFQLTDRINTSTRAGITAKVITCIYPFPGDSDKLLIGTYQQGAFIFNIKNKTFRNYIVGNLPENISIYKFLYDKKGNLWIATLDGLIRYNISTKKSTVYNLTEDLKTNEVFSIVIDHSERLWIGTKLGICYLDLKSHKFFKPKLKDADKYQCTSIYTDSQDKIWFCFNKGGVLSIESNLNNHEWFTKEIGIPQNAPSSIIEDTNGNIWIGSQKGIFKITKSGSVLSYNTENGLSGIIFAPESAFRDKSGNLWWLNETGFVKLAANKKLNSDKSYRTLLFTQLSINGTAYSTDTVSGLTKSSNKYILKIKGKNNNHLGFEFSLVNTYNNKQNRYSYKMQGLDSGWSKPSPNNQIEYTKLNTGKNLLEVIASSDEEGKIAQKVSIEIHIIPYFYETSWFILILAVLLIGITFTLTWSYFKIFIKKLSQQFAEVRQKSEKTVSLKLSNEKCKQIQESLENFMLREKPYLQPDFKIAEAAKVTGYGLHEISYVLNNELNTNFADYINSFRIEELIKIMSESLYGKYTLSAIAEKCGFNSKTTFYRAFKKHKGISPSEYFKRGE